MNEWPQAVAFHSRMIIDLGLDGEDDTCWVVIRTQEGFQRLRDTFCDYANVPVSPRTEAEWLVIIESVFASQLLRLGRAQQPLGDVTSTDPSRRD